MCFCAPFAFSVTPVGPCRAPSSLHSLLLSIQHVRLTQRDEETKELLRGKEEVSVLFETPGQKVQRSKCR